MNGVTLNTLYLTAFMANLASRGLSEKPVELSDENVASLLAGFEPARGNPNGFRVHRLNHSATTTPGNINSN